MKKPVGLLNISITRLMRLCYLLERSCKSEAKELEVSKARMALANFAACRKRVDLMKGETRYLTRD